MLVRPALAYALGVLAAGLPLRGITGAGTGEGLGLDIEDASFLQESGNYFLNMFGEGSSMGGDSKTAELIGDQAHVQMGTGVSMMTRAGVTVAEDTHELLAPPYSWMVRLGTDMAEVDHPGLKKVEDIPELVNLAAGYAVGAPDAMRYADLARSEKGDPFKAPTASDLPSGIHMAVKEREEAYHQVDPVKALKQGNVLSAMEGVVAGDGKDEVSEVAVPAFRVVTGQETMAQFANEAATPIASVAFGKASHLAEVARPSMEIITGEGDMETKGKKVVRNLAQPVAEQIFGDKSTIANAAKPAMDILLSEKDDMYAKAAGIAGLGVPLAEAALGDKNPMARLVHPMYDAAVNGKLEYSTMVQMAQEYAPQMVDPGMDMLLGKDNPAAMFVKPMAQNFVKQQLDGLAVAVPPSTPHTPTQGPAKAAAAAAHPPVQHAAGGGQKKVGKTEPATEPSVTKPVGEGDVLSS